MVIKGGVISVPLYPNKPQRLTPKLIVSKKDCPFSVERNAMKLLLHTEKMAPSK